MVLQRVAVVTDSTASLPQEVCQRHGIAVVPMQLRVGDEVLAEPDVATGQLLSALDSGMAIEALAPSQEAMFAAYSHAQSRDVSAVVSVHVSGQLSNATVKALGALPRVRIPVHLVDSQSSGMTLGFAAVAAARAARAGGNAEQVSAAAQRTAKSARVVIYVDTMRYLHRAGHVGKAAATIGSTLSVKPILTVNNGNVELMGRGVGGGRSVARMVNHAVDLAGSHPVDIAVEHFAAPEEGAEVLATLRRRIPMLRETVLTQVSSAIGANVGPGALAVTVSPVLTEFSGAEATAAQLDRP